MRAAYYGEMHPWRCIGRLLHPQHICSLACRSVCLCVIFHMYRACSAAPQPQWHIINFSLSSLNVFPHSYNTTCLQGIAAHRREKIGLCSDDPGRMVQNHCGLNQAWIKLWTMNYVLMIYWWITYWWLILERHITARSFTSRSSFLSDTLQAIITSFKGSYCIFFI